MPAAGIRLALVVPEESHGYPDRRGHESASRCCRRCNGRLTVPLLEMRRRACSLRGPRSRLPRPLGGAGLGAPARDFTVNTYSGLVVRTDGIELRFVLDVAEIPTFQAKSRGLTPMTTGARGRRNWMAFGRSERRR